jgi:hypothetical protein
MSQAASMPSDFGRLRTVYGQFSNASGQCVDGDLVCRGDLRRYFSDDWSTTGLV